MPFFVLQPPKDEAQFAELGKEIYAAAKAFGMTMEAEGFLLAWVGGTRVIVERIDGKIASLALVTIGKRWTYSDFTATVLFYHGSDQMLEFIKQIAAALGASALFHEARELDSTPERTTYEVVKYYLT